MSTGAEPAAIAAASIALLLLLAIAVSYNRFVRQRNLVRDCWSNVDTELRRRYDLIPNLVETVKGYAVHERSVIEQVVATRSAAVADTRSAGSQSGTENAFVGALRSLFAVVEGYPELRASAHFLELQRELANTEDRIQAARRFYNNNVRDYNIRLQSFPSNLVASAFGFRLGEYFEVEPAVRTAPPAAPTT